MAHHSSAPWHVSPSMKRSTFASLLLACLFLLLLLLITCLTSEVLCDLGAVQEDAAALSDLRDAMRPLVESWHPEGAVSVESESNTLCITCTIGMYVCVCVMSMTYL